MPEERVAHLHRALNTFDVPDTGTPRETRLPEGTYTVLQVTVEDDTEFAQLAVADLDDGETWICSRWQSQRYAEIEDRALPEPVPPVDHGGDPAAIPEATLIEVLQAFVDFEYTRHDARYPFALDGFGLPVAPPLENNCCTFVEALVFGAWQRAHPGVFDLSRPIHRRMMVEAPDYYSPVNALIELGMATPVDLDAPPPPWTVVQGWQSQWGKGHTFIVVDVDPETRRVLTLESNKSSALRLDGVGCRAIGNLRDLPGARPPAAGRKDEDVLTWSGHFTRFYPFRRGAALKVTDVGWARSG